MQYFIILQIVGTPYFLLHVMVVYIIFHRCQLWEKNMELKDMKDQLNELVTLLQQSETQRKELVKEQKMREQTVAIALSTSASVRILIY